MAQLKCQVVLVAERHSGVVIKTEVACIERDADGGVADLGLHLAEVKRLTAALQAETVSAQMATLGVRRLEPPAPSQRRGVQTSMVPDDGRGRKSPKSLTSHRGPAVLSAPASCRARPSSSG